MHSLSSKSSGNKYYSPSEMEPEDEVKPRPRWWSQRKRHNYFESDRHSSNSRHQKSRTSNGNQIGVIQQAISRICEVLDYRTYRLPDKSSYYDDEAATRMSKWVRILHVQMKSQNFDSFILIYSVSFLLVFELACDVYWVHSGSAL